MGRRHRHLARRRSQIAPKKKITIFCEGQKTEPGYFTALRKAWPNTLIELEIVPAGGVPYALAQKAVRLARDRGLMPRSRKSLDSFEEGDQVWAVFDRDQHPRFQEAVGLCEQARVGVGRSNPCFELWLILHEEEYDKPDGRQAVQKHLRTLRPEYNPKASKSLDCDELVARVTAAETRASKQLQRREAEGSPFGVPSTTVGQLTIAIRHASKREL